MSDQYPSSEAGEFDARPPAPEPVAGSQPWHRQVRFMLPVGLVAGLVLGAAATGGSSATPTPNAAAPSTAATVSAAAPVTTTVTATKTVRSVQTTTATKTAPAAAPRSERVQAVLDAWTNAGPQPDKQARAMQRLEQEWPTLAQALEPATGVTVPKAAAAAPTTVTTRQTSAPAPGVYYANCAAARAAGAAPIYMGEPGYRAGLDRDGDGVACE